MMQDGLQRTSARLFSNPAGDYGSMVNERVGASTWEDGAELGDTWASRNAFSYGRCVYAGLDLVSLLLFRLVHRRRQSHLTTCLPWLHVCMTSCNRNPHGINLRTMSQAGIGSWHQPAVNSPYVL